MTNTKHKYRLVTVSENKNLFSRQQTQTTFVVMAALKAKPSKAASIINFMPLFVVCLLVLLLPFLLNVSSLDFRFDENYFFVIDI